MLFRLLGVFDIKYQNVESLGLIVIVRDITVYSPLLSLGLKRNFRRMYGFYLVVLWTLAFSLCKDNLHQKFCGSTKTFHVRKIRGLFAKIAQTVTHSDKHVREGSSGVFRHIDGRDDPVSLLSPQPIGRGDSLMSSRKFDNSGLGVPDSRQHFFKANLKTKKNPHI